MTERRKREVGVRKVFGASPSGVVRLLTREFLILVLLAFGLSAPITTLAMRPWLESFAYRVEPGPGLYLLAAGMALLIAGLTVSYQAVRASRMNPIDSLRYD